MTTGKYIRSLRCSRDMLLREVASELNIDQSLLSNIERDERQATRDQIIHLSSLFNVENDSLLISWLTDRVLKNLEADRDVLDRVITEVKRRAK